MAHLKKRNGHLLRVGPPGAGHLVRACFAGCVINFFQDNCQLFWEIETSSTNFTVDIFRPGGSSYSSTNNTKSGVISAPTAGFWSITVTLHDIDGGCVSSVEYEVPPEPCLPCCRKTIGLHGVYTGIVANEQRANYHFPTSTWRELWIGNHTAANVAWYRDMTGPKTPETCYGAVTPVGDTLIGTGTERSYHGASIAGPSSTCPSEADFITSGNYHVIDAAFDVYLRFNATTVRVIGVLTATSLSTVGSPVTAAPALNLIGTEFTMIGQRQITGSFSWIGTCGIETQDRLRSGILATTNFNSCPPTTPFPTNIFFSSYTGWPEIEP